MANNNWDPKKKRRLAKNWASLTNPSSSSPSYTISDVLTAELLKGASDSGVSSSKNSQQRMGPSRSTPLIAETELSVSIPALGPLYDLSYYNRLLNADSILPKKNPSEGSGNSSDAVRRRHATLNQIPEQFSEFILEQGAVTESSRARQISDLMGSQATIFSTRENDRSPSRSSRLRQKSVKAGIDYTNDGFNRPQRRNAIRFRPGSKFYRAYLRMRRFASYVKKRMTLLWEFVAKSKRASATTQLNRVASKTGRRWPKKLPKTIRGKVSGPVNNPDLGKLGGAKRVSALTDDVRAMAGMIKTQPDQGDPFHEGVGKLSHLSNYIKEQKDMTPVNASGSAFLSENSAPPPPPPPHGRPSIAFRNTPEHITNPRPLIDEIEEIEDSGSSIVTTPKYQPKLQNTHQLNDMGITLWKQYLSNVTALRIRLRQEIALFQALAAGQQIPSFFEKTPPESSKIEESRSAPAPVIATPSEKLEHSKPSSVSYIMSQKASILDTEPDRKSHVVLERVLSNNSDTMSLVQCKPSQDESDTDYVFSLTQSVSAYSVHIPSPSEKTSSVQTATSLEYSDSSDGATIDESVDKFQKVLNRRSMLGEMLDYDSEDDDASTITLQTSQDTFDSAVVRRYGTILSAHGTNTNLVSRSSSVYTPLGLTRSPGFNTDLHLIS